MRRRKIFQIAIIFLLVGAWIFSGSPRFWQNPPIPPEIKEAKAAGSVIGAVQGPTYSVSTEQVGGSDAHILTLTNPGTTANYKWQFLTGGLRFFIDRKAGVGWVQLVSLVQTVPQYIEQKGPVGTCVWKDYGLDTNTTGGNVLQGFDRQNQADGSVKMVRTYSGSELGTAETLTETWNISASAYDLAEQGLKVSYSMTKNRGIILYKGCWEGTWQMKWELSGIADITADNSNMLGEDGKPLKQKYYSNDEFLISVLDFVVQAGDTVHSFSKVASNNKASITFFPSGTIGNRVIDPTVGTTASLDALVACYLHNITYANGYYWAFYYDSNAVGTVYKSSADGSTWSATSTIFSTASAPTGGTPTLKWSVRHIAGTNRILVTWSDAAAAPNGKVYFRRGTMGSDGTITWDSNDITARNSAGTPIYPTVSEDSAGYPYLAWRGLNGANPVRPIEESKSTSTSGVAGSWDTNDHEFLTLNSALARGGVLFDIGSQNMYGISVEGGAGNVVGNKYTSSTATWGTDSNIATDVITTIGNALLWSAVNDSSGNIHLVYIDNTSDIRHYKYTVSTASWALVDADVLTGTSTKVTLAADGNNLYVFYVDSAQTNQYIYYKQYNGSVWGTQSTLKADTTAINGAISAYEFSANNEVGVIWVEEAGANDNVVFGKISTTGNTAPSFTVNPTESPTSSAVLPTNDSSSLMFLATATDPETNNYYLAICKTNSVTPGTGGDAPTCGGGNWCVSSATSSGSQATCSYTAVEGDAEANEWYGFACDAASADQLCSFSSQGSGLSGSPFKVNHRPSFTVFTDDSPKDPAATVTWIATSSDSDTDTVADTVSLFVCKDSDFTGTVCGAGGTWCSTTTQASNPTCNAAALRPDGDWNAYGYVIDNHAFAASGGAQATNSTLTVNNVSPSISAATIQLLDTDEAGNLTLTTAEGETTGFKAKFTVVDNNSCQNISSGNEISSSVVHVRMSEVTQGSCDADGEDNTNNCYANAHTGTSGSCSQDGGTCSGQTDTDAAWTCLFPLQYNADPTVTNAQKNAYIWIAAVKSTDDDAADTGLVDDSDGTEMGMFLSYDISEASIAYTGPLAPGATSTEKTTTMEATGNIGLDEELSGTNMTSGGNTIAVGQQHHSFSTGFVWDDGTALTVTSTEYELNCQKTTSTSSPAQKLTYWQLKIPAVQPTGSYSGTSTITGVTGESAGW